MAIRASGVKLTGLVGTVLAALPGQANAAEAVLRVVDVGNALCVVAAIPGDHFMLYDAGGRGGGQCAAAVREIVGSDRLDLVVLSHPDEDHNGQLAAILAATPADMIIHTGARLSSNISGAIRTELRRANRRRAGSVRSLATQPLPNMRSPSPGQARAAPLAIELGDARITFVAGWHKWNLPADRGASLSRAEKRNAISIVVRFDYGGKSVLLSGDAIGRRGRGTEPADACRDAAKWMVREGNVPLDSDVLVGEHHGGDNSSALCFYRSGIARMGRIFGGKLDE
jgi:beta-lactamase superfamily II metal-dependent hydrolase